jgi:hypothetical protein
LRGRKPRDQHDREQRSSQDDAHRRLRSRFQPEPRLTARVSRQPWFRLSLAGKGRVR